MTDIFRKEYKLLTEVQKTQISLIKTNAIGLLDAINFISATEPNVDIRCMEIAKTELETSVMWAIKGITV
jgi:hypothetical protein